MDILIEESQGALWAAALNDGKLEGLEIDPTNEQVRWGSIYYGIVKTIDPARDAAFIDLGAGNTGILYNKNVRLKAADDTLTKGGDKAIGQAISPGDVIMVQAKTAYMSGVDDTHVREHKLPEVSMDITLQGRHLIYCPYLEGNRLSKRITNKNLRKKIDKMMTKLDDIQGCILRVAAANAQTDILQREGKILKNAWEEILKLPKTSEPELLMGGPDAIQRILSDQANNLIDRIEIVTMDHYHHAESWCAVFAPDIVPKITPIELDDASEDLALFYERDIMGQIEDLFQPYCMLSNGANLIIQNTAALTAIDVNKGGHKGSHLDTNLAAVKETARQLRLRNIGGVILLDCLNTKSKKERDLIIEALKEAASADSCTVQIHGFTGTGLLEITRNRRTATLNQRVDIDEIS